jgi:hypothetical protein
MRQSLRCGDNAMNNSDNKWVFNDEPETVGYWLRSVTVEKINCVFEEISLAHEDESDFIHTPLGKANITHRSISHNHMKLFWIDTYAKPTEIVLRELESGEGLWYESTTKDNMILLDKANQVDFHVQWLPRCQNVKCDKNQSEWTVVNNHHLFVKRKVIQLDAKQQFKPPQIPRSVNYWENIELMNTHQNYAIQYLADQAVRHENDIIRLIQSVQCEQRRIKHAQAVSTAQYNGWLAASQLGLRKCVKLAATGNTVSAIECAPINVTFTTEITSCGAQPRYKNFTVSRTGWELAAYKDCYWTSGTVNFNDRPHSYRNFTWQLVETSIVWPQRDLANAFRYSDVKFFDYQQKANPAYADSMTSPMDIIADLTSSINEHTAKGSPQDVAVGASNVIVAAVEKSASSFSNWRNILVFLVSIPILAVAITLLIATDCFGIPRSIKYCITLIPKRNDESNNSDDSECEMTTV